MSIKTPDNLRNKRQEDLELDPEDYDASANVDVETLDISPAELFEQALEQTRMAVTIVDINRPDSPIIYANQAFTELTGYDREEVIGRNCRFLQGPETDPDAVQAIRDCIASGEVRVVEILNYHKDGSTFWNSLHIGPVYDKQGKLTHLYGSQWDITSLVEERSRLALQTEVAEELKHRTKNLFNAISAIVRMSARGETDVDALMEKLEARLLALGRAHSISISEGRTAGQASDLYDLIASILDPYQEVGKDRVILSGPVVQVPRQSVTPVGLMLHELATNALKYGALSTPEGTVSVSWRRQAGRLVLEWLETGGPETKAPTRRGGGTRMMDGVLRVIGASITQDWPPSGLHAKLDLPLDDDAP